MPKLKVIASICIFSIFLGITSFVKTKTRIIEKKIYKFEKKIAFTSKDLHETQLDYSYLSSPSYLSKKIMDLDFIEYFPIDFSKIYLSYKDFSDAQKKITVLEKDNEKKIQKN